MKLKVWDFFARSVAEFPRILFGRERGNLRCARLGLIKWLMYSPRKTTSRISSSNLEVCCKCRIFIFEQIFGLEIDVRYVQFWCCCLAEKLAFWALLPKRTGDMQWKSGGWFGLLAVMMAKIHQLVPFTRYRDRVTWCFYCGKMGKAILGFPEFRFISELTC